MKSRGKTLKLERLERRELFATYQIPWPEIDHLSLSFIPDGTQVGNRTSELFGAMERSYPSLDWQLEILRAFQTWAVETNGNVAIANDQGRPVGTVGFKQGDVRFGDARIGAFLMDEDVLAVANPYDPFIANTWVGDVFLNVMSHFLESSANPSQALFSIMLHEAGHVFGVGHSQDPLSPMFPHLQNAYNLPTTADIASLRLLYGLRQADAWEGAEGNDSLQKATRVSLLGTHGLPQSTTWHGDVGSKLDVDTFVLDVPTDIFAADVRLISAGKSMLTATLSILNQGGDVIESVRADDPRTNDLQLKLNNIRAGETLYVRIEGARDSVFGIGAYDLEIYPQLSSSTPAPPLSLPEIDEHPFEASEYVLETTPGYVEYTYYEVEGTLTAARPSRTYRFRAADVDPTLSNIYTVIIGSEDTSIDEFELSITDVNGIAIPYEILLSNNETLAIQVKNIQSAVDYLIRIDTKQELMRSAHYEIEVDFAHDGGRLETIVNDVLNDAQPLYDHPLRIDQSQVMHFVLSTTDWNLPQDSGLEMEIIDTMGRSRFFMLIHDGATRKADVFLDRGDYRVRFSSPNRVTGSTVVFQWSGLTSSSPIGPLLRDTTRVPVESEDAVPLSVLTAFFVPEQIDTNAGGKYKTDPFGAASIVTLASSGPAFVRLFEPQLYGFGGEMAAAQFQAGQIAKPDPESQIDKLSKPSTKGNTPIPPRLEIVGDLKQDESGDEINYSPVARALYDDSVSTANSVVKSSIPGISSGEFQESSTTRQTEVSNYERIDGTMLSSTTDAKLSVSVECANASTVDVFRPLNYLTRWASDPKTLCVSIAISIYSSVFVPRHRALLRRSDSRRKAVGTRLRATEGWGNRDTVRSITS